MLEVAAPHVAVSHDRIHDPGGEDQSRLAKGLLAAGRGAVRAAAVGRGRVSLPERWADPIAERRRLEKTHRTAG